MSQDWYKLCEDAVHEKLKALAQVKQPEKQMSYGDDRILSQGFSYFLRSKPGAFASKKDTTNSIEYVWHIMLETYTKFDKSLENTWLNFRAFRSDITNEVNHDDTLNKTTGVRETAVDAPSEPVYVSFEEDDRNAPIFIMQILDISVLQKVPRKRS